MVLKIYNPEGKKKKIVVNRNVMGSSLAFPFRINRIWDQSSHQVDQIFNFIYVHFESVKRIQNMIIHII